MRHTGGEENLIRLSSCKDVIKFICQSVNIADIQANDHPMEYWGTGTKSRSGCACRVFVGLHVMMTATIDFVLPAETGMLTIQNYGRQGDTKGDW